MRVIQLVCLNLLPRGYVGAAYVLKIRNSLNTGNTGNAVYCVCIYTHAVFPGYFALSLVPTPACSAIFHVGLTPLYGKPVFTYWAR